MNKKVFILCALFLFFSATFIVPIKTFAANSHSLDLELGSSQSASIASGSQTGLSISGDLTIEAWVKSESQPGEWPPGRMIVAKLNSDCGYEILYIKQDNVYYLTLWLGTGSGLSGFSHSSANPILPDGVWTHIAFVYDTSTKVELFINGISVYSTTSSVPASISTNSSTFYIGADDGGDWHFWDGLIDDVRVWNTNRSATQIASSYNSELIGTETNLQGYWKLNNNYNDETSNNNDLSGSGSPVFSVDVPSFSAAAILAVRKTADETVANSTTLQNDDELVLTLNPASSVYFIEGLVLASSASDTPDIKIAFTVPSGATMDISYIASRGSTFNHGELLETSGGASIGIPIDNVNVTVIMVRGTVKLSSTTGNLTLQWAQNTSNGTATTVKEGSYLSATKLY